jgi:hypothetical protein
MATFQTKIIFRCTCNGVDSVLIFIRCTRNGEFFIPIIAHCTRNGVDSVLIFIRCMRNGDFSATDFCPLHAQWG